MRTYAAHQSDLAARRYDDDAEDTRHHDASTAQGAKLILSSKGGKAAAKLAAAALWQQANEPGGGYLPTARLHAPLHVLRAMQTMGVIEEAQDERGRAIRFRLTEAGLRAALIMQTAKEAQHG